jgi:hypothetical protein
MKTFAIFPWAMDSEPAWRLQKAMSRKLGYNVEMLYGHKGQSITKNHAILDWGRSDNPDWFRADVPWLNKPESIYNSVDKNRSFQCFVGECRTVPFTMDRDTALEWFEEGANKICCRTKTKGYDGDGLVLATKPSQVVYAPLYTKYIPAQAEYRVYVFNGKAVDWLRKSNEEGVQSQDIRTEGNGWIYVRGNYIPEDCKAQAVKAIKAVGLDFGGVDVLYSQDGKAYVLETNTAPDIWATTVSIFADEIVAWLQAL